MVPATMNEMWPSMGSTIASFLFVWAMISRSSPNEIHQLIEKLKQRLRDYFDPYIQISIHVYTGKYSPRSEAYDAVEAYLSFNCTKNAKRLRAEMRKKDKSMVFSLNDSEAVTDEFQGVKVWWSLKKFVSPSTSGNSEKEDRYYDLMFHKRYQEMVTEKYTKHVMNEGMEIRRRDKQKKYYSSCVGSHWLGRCFKNTATFEKMAFDLEKDNMEDLLAFSRNKDFYTKARKAWKRGYLLLRPPVMGKSTMIAAMANMLGYDMYDLELTAVKDNIEHRSLLIDTGSKYIIVIEDIDCSLDLTGQKEKDKKSSGEDEKDESNSGRGGNCSSKVIPSGLLNFVDGLWSSCVVFTTNHVEKLDPALIRSGRMDKYIELSYCSFRGFKVFAKNYLNLEKHHPFDRIEILMKETNISPADVAENLMPKSPMDDPEGRLSNLIQALEEAKDAAAKKKGEEAVGVQPTMQGAEEN